MSGLLASEDPRLAILIVGHESPMDHVPSDARVQFLDCGLASAAAGSARSPSVIIADKLRKLTRGREYARERLPSRFTMSVDPDDFISRKLVGFLASADAPGYRINRGWIWNTGDRCFIEQSDEFDKICGSSVIFRSDVADLDFRVHKIASNVPAHIAEVADQMKFTLFANEMHSLSPEGLAAHAMEMDCVPFRAAVYRIGNPNSYMQRRARFHSFRFFVGRLRRTRLLTKSLRREFSVDCSADARSRAGADHDSEKFPASLQRDVHAASREVERVLTFIIPFMAKIDDEQWSDRCAKLRQTLASILNSKHRNFEVVIAGHDEPAGLPRDERLHYLPADFAPPPIGADIVARRRDMIWKIRIAWEYAQRNWQTRYVMRVDADDLVSHSLVEWLAANGRQAGYKITKGWIAKDSWRRWLKKEDAFYLSCGSSVIVDARYADLEIKVTPDQKKAEGLAVDDDPSKDARHRRTLLVANKHGKCVQNFEDLGLAITDLPERAVVYRLGSRHSLSRDAHTISSLKMLLSSASRMRPITGALRREFAL